MKQPAASSLASATPASASARALRPGRAPRCPFALSRGSLLVASVLLGGLALSATGPAAAAAPRSTQPRPAAQGEQPTNHGVFVEPLVASRPPSAQEQRELLAAIGAYRSAALARHGETDAYGHFEPLLAYLQAHPQSPWASSLLANIGWREQRLGYVSRALETLARADASVDWQALRHAHSELRAQADAVRGSELALSARLGRLDATRELLARPDSAHLTGAAGQQAEFAGAALAQMQREPEAVLRCGWVALSELLRVTGAPEAQRQRLDEQRAGPQGSTLAQLAQWSQDHGLGFEPVRRTAGQPLPVPSVVHLRSGHFATISEASGEGLARRVHLLDNVAGTNEWVSQQAIDDEASGFYLAPRQRQGPWQLASAEEAGQVRGAGNPRPYNQTATSPNDKTLGGNSNQPPCGCAAIDGAQVGGESAVSDSDAAPGMPVYAVQALTAGLTIHDTPLSYTPAVGPRMDFSLYYSQKDQLLPAVANFSNLGVKWTHNWLAYIADDPNNIGQNVSGYQRGGGGWNYTGYQAADGSFAREGMRTQLVLVSTNPLRYERRFADGSKEVYGWSDGATAAPRRVFLTQVVDPYGNAATLSYGSLNRLISITDALGKVTTVNYNAAPPRRIVGFTDPFGRTTRITYDANNHLKTITDAMQMVSSFDYAVDDITAMTTPYGTTRFSFGVVSDYQRWVEATDPYNFTERVEYNSGKNNLPASDPNVPNSATVENANLNNRDTFYFDKNAYLLAKDPATGLFDYTKAAVTHWAEQSINGVTSVSPVVLATKLPLEAWEYTQFANMPPSTVGGSTTYKTVTDTYQPTSSQRYPASGPARISSASYNNAGNRNQYIDPVGRETDYNYAPNLVDLQTVYQRKAGSTGPGDLVLKASNYVNHLPQQVTDAAGQTTTYTYTPAGQVATVTNPLQQKVTYNYDPTTKHLLSIVDPNSVTRVTYTYDAVGRLRTELWADGTNRTYDYDNLNRLTRITYPDGSTEVFTWLLMDVNTVKDRLNHVTTYRHDALRAVDMITDADQNTTQLHHDAAGNLVRLVDARNNTTVFTPDLEGRLIGKQYPGGALFQFSYDEFSREATRTDASLRKRTTTYFTDGRPSSYVYSGGTAPKQLYTYDPVYPRLASVTTNSTGEAITFAYQPAGSKGAGQLALESSNASGALPVSYSYDGLGRLASRSIGSGAAGTDTFIYDSLGRPKTHAGPLGSFTLAYDGQSSRPLSQTLAGVPWQTQYTWDTVNKDRMLTGITHSPAALSRGPGTMARLQGLAQSLGLTPQQRLNAGVAPAGWSSANDLRYTNATGQITGRGQGLDSWSYAYDDLLRLTNVSYTGSVAGGRSHVYTYDATDNLATIQSTPGALSTYATNADNQVLSVTGSGQTTSWLYDPNGNLTDDGVNVYTWDAEQRLVRIKRKGDGQVSNFAYDGLGRRVSITETKKGDTAPNKTTRYIWCGSSPTPCAANGTAGLTMLEPEGEFNAATVPTQQYYARDHQGSVMQMVDNQGNTLGARQYTAYGQTYAASGVSPTLGYAGMLYHAPSGLYLTPNRAYNPGSGRWLSRDPIGEDGGSNLYAYVNVNPLRYTDPFGLSALGTGLGFVGAWGGRIGGAFVGEAIFPAGGGVPGALIGGKLGNAAGVGAGDWLDSVLFSKAKDDEVGGTCPINKGGGDGGMPGNNRAQNKQARQAAAQAGLNDQQQRILHDAISGQGHGWQDILEIAMQIKAGQW